MASYRFQNHPNQVRDSSSSSLINTRHGFSKSQMCLHKILHIISTCPSQEISKGMSLNREISEFEENRGGVGIDLNMGLSPVWPEVVPDDHENQSSEESSLLSACSFVEKGLKRDSSLEVLTADKSSSEGECNVNDSSTIQAVGEESQVVDEPNLDISKISTTGVLANEITIDEDRETTVKEEDNEKSESVKMVPFQEENNSKTNKDCLALLIEAADLVSGDDHHLADHKKESCDNSEKPEETTNNGPERSCDCGWVVDLYEENTSPAARSKRKRSQVLPCRYRDSSVILEPWKRLPRPTKAEPTVVSKKRKSR